MTERAAESELSRTMNAIGRVISFSPWLFTSVIAFNVLAALMEGLGLSLIIPIIELIQSGNQVTGQSEGYARWFVMAYNKLGITFSLGTVTAGVIFIMSVRFSVTFVTQWLTVIMKARYVKHLQDKLLTSTLQAKVFCFDEKGTDEVLNAIVKQAAECRRFIKFSMKLLFLTLLSGVYMAIALMLSPLLMGVAIFLLGGVTLVFNRLLTSGEQIGSRLAESNEEIQTAAQTGTQGIREIKLLGLKNILKEEFTSATEEKTRSRVKIGRNESLIYNYYNLATIGAIFGIIYIAYYFTSLTLSSMGLFLVTLFRFSPKISGIYSTYYNVVSHLSHVERTHEFIEYLDRHQDESGVSVPLPVTGIEVKNLGFSYEEERILRDVSFDLKRGKISAFVGASGAGKSTIASILAGFYAYDEGEILLNQETYLRQVDRDSWWNHVAYIRQNPFIFNTTLRENLRFGNDNVREAQLHQVIDDMLIDEFFDDLNNGLDTELGDNGVRLSGGQCQRVALARALLRSSQLIILDEATSALDYDLENRIYENLQTYFDEKIVVIIAHRLATIKMADEINVLESGQIVEHGTHEELLEQEGVYETLYQEQQRNALVP